MRWSKSGERETDREEELERRKTWNPRIEKNASYFSKGKVNALDFSFFWILSMFSSLSLSPPFPLFLLFFQSSFSCSIFLPIPSCLQVMDRKWCRSRIREYLGREKDMERETGRRRKFEDDEETEKWVRMDFICSTILLIFSFHLSSSPSLFLFFSHFLIPSTRFQSLVRKSSLHIRMRILPFLLSRLSVMI